MGLFDSVYIDWNGQDRNIEWQTKDLPYPYLNTYTVNREGRLIFHKVTYENTPIREKPYPNAKKGSYEYCFGMIRPAKTEFIDMDYHGVIHLFGPDHKDWLLKFTDGYAVSLRKVKENGR